MPNAFSPPSPENKQVDPLERFVRAQENDYASALSELAAGWKKTHWIWYILPQLGELGRSQMALFYGISGSKEAAAYFAHPVLGPRLIECVNTILTHTNCSAVEILGNTDAMKFRSCLTLFASVAPDEPAFAKALAAFYDGKPDEQTIRLLTSATR